MSSSSILATCWFIQINFIGLIRVFYHDLSTERSAGERRGIQFFESTHVITCANWARIVFNVHWVTFHTSINRRTARHEMMIADPATPAS